jgi:hypothetical protein
MSTASSSEVLQAKDRIVSIAREIQQAMYDRPVDITNETRWELDPTLLNALSWELNALDRALRAEE